MSIATVVLRGYGRPAYADVTKLPTLGYSSRNVGPGAITKATTYRPAVNKATTQPQAKP